MKGDEPMTVIMDAAGKVIQERQLGR